MTLSKKGQIAEAFLMFERSVELDSTFVDGLINLAKASTQIGRTEIASRSLERVKRLDPANPRLTELQNLLAEEESH